MSKIAEDITGMKFGRLTAIQRAPNDTKYKKPYTRWVCKCECGNEIIAYTYALKNGHIRSCGCLKADIVTERINKTNYKHGESNTKLFKIWCGMRKRCENESEPGYKYYGARGITVCDEWHEYNTFKEWSITHGYADGLSIDRIDNNGNYCPGNCRWADKYTQANNTSRNHIIEVNGVAHTIAEWSRIMGYKPYIITNRLRRGWSESDAVMTPVRHTA